MSEIAIHLLRSLFAVRARAVDHLGQHIWPISGWIRSSRQPSACRPALPAQSLVLQRRKFPFWKERLMDRAEDPRIFGYCAPPSRLFFQEVDPHAMVLLLPAGIRNFQYCDFLLSSNHPGSWLGNICEDSSFIFVFVHFWLMKDGSISELDVAIYQWNHDLYL